MSIIRPSRSYAHRWHGGQRCCYTGTGLQKVFTVQVETLLACSFDNDFLYGIAAQHATPPANRPLIKKPALSWQNAGACRRSRPSSYRQTVHTAARGSLRAWLWPQSHRSSASRSNPGIQKSRHLQIAQKRRQR